MDVILNGIAVNWVSVNGFTIWLVTKIRWEVSGLEGLKKKDWYLVLPNHQSWNDIVVLQKVFNKKIPFLKFFIKSELIWVPILGLAWWAMDMPFMKRYSEEEVRRAPSLKGKDLEITKKACERFKNVPISIINFVEGTRVSP